MVSRKHSNRFRVVAYSLLAVFALGEFYSAVSRDESMWPFTGVPMFSGLRARPEFRALGPVAVRDGEELHLVESGVLDFKVQRVLMRGYEKRRDSKREAELRSAIRDLVVAEAERAGVGRIDAVRVYEYTWDTRALSRGSDSARTEVLLFEEPAR